MKKHDFSLPTLSAFSERRRWFLRSSTGLASALGVGTVGNLLVGARSAQAADYKALVCVFLYGGNDGMNTIVPTDAARYQQYAQVRKGLAIAAGNLKNLSGINYGLHPALSALLPAWNEGQLAPVFNVGPLNRLMSKADFRAASSVSGVIPESLYSHSDQQTLWEAATSTVQSRTGWGGRASSVLGTANPVISVSGNTRFGQSNTQPPLVLPGAPGEMFGVQRMQPQDLTWEYLADRKAVIDLMYSQPNNLTLADAYASTQRNALLLSSRLSGLVQITPRSSGANAVIDAAFAPLIDANNSLTTHLGRQLYQVAKLVYGNATVGGNRQIFFTEMSGFDTHAQQSITGSPAEGAHARLLQELGDALACFNAAMKNLGLGGAVTTFTQSDFGRTFLPNNNQGTDHGWGSHHLVMGGAVKGGATYGVYPDLTLGGVNDVGVEPWESQGRWLPSSSVDQYAATLLNWFGATDGQLLQILPNLVNYPTGRLGFL
jgi:uncharacterized protein (DUF1501 family)